MTYLDVLAECGNYSVTCDRINSRRRGSSQPGSSGLSLVEHIVSTNNEPKRAARLGNSNYWSRRTQLLHKETCTGSGKLSKPWRPKTKRRQLQLYKEGHIMSPTDEMKWIIQAFGERYGAREHNASSRLREHPPVQITEAEIHRQLGLLPVRKAVPPEAAPAALWRACIDETTPFIASEVNRQWSEPELTIQQDWADAKARTDSPLDWRPIGLQNPVGKTLMKILVARAKDQIHQLVTQYLCAPSQYTHSSEAGLSTLCLCSTTLSETKNHNT